MVLRPSASWFALLLCLAAAPPALAGKKRLTLEQASGRGTDAVSFSGSTPLFRFDDAGNLLRGRGRDAVRIDPDTLAESKLPDAEGPDAGGAGDRLRSALRRLDGMDEKGVESLLRARRQTAKDGKTTLMQRGTDLVVARDDQAFLLAGGGGPEIELAQLASDGSAVTFVRENNLWCWPVGSEAFAITTQGSDELFCGKLDWVYQEEIYGRGDFQGHWWSPDSRHVAFLELDESPVHEFTVVDHIEPGHFRVKAEVTNYPKVGDPNPVVALKVADVAARTVATVDLSRYAEDEPLVVRVGFTPDGSRLLAVVQDRIQTWAELLACDPATGAFDVWIRETNDSWVERPEEPRFLKDGGFLWQSHRTDHHHVYRYDAHGKLIGAVTAGPWSVTGIDHVDEERGLMWFQANKDGAVNQNLYRIRLDGGDLRRLTQGDGWHEWTFNADRSCFIDLFSSLEHPPEWRRCDADGKVLKVLAKVEVPAAEEYLTSQWDLVEIECRDGFKLDAALLKPAPFDRRKRYPVWIPTYSGPNAPSVRNRWNGSSWYQFLAQQGVIVLQVNVRTASGKGHYAIEQCYQQLGVQELKDLEDAVDWVCRNPWADESRVGITGYSYGGFMTAYALTHSDRFALGIAGGGVYDWRMYDTIYTERYMSTPKRNPDGYERTSVIGAAKHLKGHLLIHHGVMDDNVHEQNAMHLIDALQRADKQFELMLYPQSRHGVRGDDLTWHLRQLEWNTMRDVFGVGRTAL